MNNSSDNVFQNISVGKSEACLFNQFLGTHGFSDNTNSAFSQDIRKFAKWFSESNREVFLVVRADNSLSHIIQGRNVLPFDIYTVNDYFGCNIHKDRNKVWSCATHNKSPKFFAKKDTVFAIVWHDDKLRLFINGQLADERHQQNDFELPKPNSQSEPLDSSVKIVCIGGRSSSRMFKGIIGEVRISNIARYTKDYTPAKRFETDKHTMALYHFDEAEGDVLKDSSGNGHHGKIVGAKWVKVNDELKVIGRDEPTASTHVWSKEQPAPAIAPFTAKQAKQHQEEWAKHLSVDVETTNSIGMKFRVIPPGEFLMGSSKEEIASLLEEAKEQKLPDRVFEQIPNEGPQHRVTLTKPFGMSIHEVTRGQFRQFVDATGYKTDAEKDGKGGGGNKEGKWVQAPEFLWNTNLGFDTEQTDDDPVVNVSWNDAVAFCKWLSEKEGVTYRLPTEAQWEFACRAGSLARFSFGDDESLLDGYAWFGSYGGSNTKPVGQKQPNSLGLFDLHGNVLEWCHDRHGPYTTTAVDPVGPSQGSDRVMRGGSFADRASSVRSAISPYYLPTYRGIIFGFRASRTYNLSP